MTEIMLSVGWRKLEGENSPAVPGGMSEEMVGDAVAFLSGDLVGGDVVETVVDLPLMELMISEKGKKREARLTERRDSPELVAPMMTTTLSLRWWKEVVAARPGGGRGVCEEGREGGRGKGEG